MKPGLSLDFMTDVLRAWLGEKDIGSVGGALKKAGLSSKLLVSECHQLLCAHEGIGHCFLVVFFMQEFLPGRQSQESFEEHFRAARLPVVIDYQVVEV